MPVRGMALAILLASAGAAGAREPLPRVASINLCADQLLLAIAAPEQIVSLGPFARDQRLSYGAVRAGEFMQNSGGAETALRGDPDLVIVGSFDSAATRRLLTASGKAVFTLPPWGGFAEGSRDIRLLAKAIKREAEGEALIAAIEVARGQARGAAEPGTRALILGRGAYIDLSASLVHDLARNAGLADLAAEAGSGASGAGRFMPLEEVVTLRPDVLIIGEGSQRGPDRRAQLFAHPAFRAAFPPREAGGPVRIALPERMTACGGPGLIEALERMAGALRAR